MEFERWFYDECLPQIVDEARRADLRRWADPHFQKINAGLKAIAADPENPEAKALQEIINNSNTTIKNNLLAELAQIQLDREKQLQQIANLVQQQRTPLRCVS